MKFTTLGRSDLRVSKVCLGTMTFGTQNTEADAHAQLDYALDRGINFIDTAEMYSVPPTAESYGRTETIIGTWLARQRREQIVIATKAAGAGRTLTWIRGGNLAFNRQNLSTALEDSLRRLRTDYVDLYQLHWPERNAPIFGGYAFEPAKERDFTPLRETLEALAELIRAGKVRHVGLSNETPWGVMEFLRLAEQHGLPRMVSVQNTYNLLNRTWESGLAEISHRERISLMSYSPLAFGLLSGKYLANPGCVGRITQFPGFGQRYSKINIAAATAAYCELAGRHGLTPTQLAMAFVNRQWFVDSNIIGATTIEQLAENIDALNVELSDEILREIEAVHLRYTNPAP